MSSTYYSNIPVDVSDTNTEIALRNPCVHGFAIVFLLCGWEPECVAIGMSGMEAMKYFLKYIRKIFANTCKYRMI